MIEKLTSLPTGMAIPNKVAGLAPRGSSSSSSSSSSFGLGLLGSVGAIGSSVLNYFNARRTERRQERLLKEQRKQALEDRAHDEWYNSPSQLLSRLKLAGVSPTSLSNVPTTDSSGMQISGDANSVANSSLAAGQAIQNGFSSALDALALNKQRAEIDKIYSDISRNQSDKNIKDLNVEYLSASLKDRVAQEHFIALSSELGLSRLSADIQHIMSLTGLTDVQKKERDLAYRLSVDTYDYSVKLARFQADNVELENKIKTFDLDRLMPAKLQNLLQQTANLRQSNYLDYARYNNECEHLELYRGNIEESTKSMRFNNSAMQETYDDYVKSLISTYNITETEAKFAATKQWMKIFSTAAASLGAAAAIAVGYGKGKSTAGMRNNQNLPSYYGDYIDMPSMVLQ